MLGKSVGDVFAIGLVAIGMFLNLALALVLLRLNRGPPPPPPPTERRVIIYVASGATVNVLGAGLTIGNVILPGAAAGSLFISASLIIAAVYEIMRIRGQITWEPQELRPAPPSS